SPAGKVQEALQNQQRLASLLGPGGFGTHVYSGMCQVDDTPVNSWHGISPTDSIVLFLQPRDTCTPPEIELLDKVFTGFHGVVQLLDWCELPKICLLVMKCSEWWQDLFDFILMWGFLLEEMVQGLLHHALEAVQHCSSCRVKDDNIVLDLATRKAKLMDFNCGTSLQVYTQFA
ncbi:PIM1 kinase, partial [Certhia familiaris]|nr:PIM1 kinase [Certhia familiaris]